MQTFSTRAAARILAVSPDRIRYWVKRRLVKPAKTSGRHFQFAFNDLLVMRLTKELLPMRHRLQPIRLCFERLGKLMDPQRSVTALKLYEEDGRMIVRDGGVKFEADTGQLILDFDLESFKREVEGKRGQPKIRSLFENAEGLEESQPIRAIEIFRDLLKHEPRNFDANLHLAALLEREGSDDDALHHYLAAAAIQTSSAEVQLRLGMLYRKRGALEAALKSFLRAVELDADLVDAHRHLAEVYEELGRKREALRHLSAVHRLTRH